MKSPVKFPAVLILLAAAFAAFSLTVLGHQQNMKIAPAWQVHKPITHSNLAVFPVTGTEGRRPTAAYLTLDEGLRNGTVEVTELGGTLHRPRPGARPQAQSRPQVNTLTLINHSQQPLLLLAGEIVTGGKQDRVVSSSRIVPPNSDLPLDVFCVEPGRWQGRSSNFKGASLMAAPQVRRKAAVAKNQQEVWNATGAVRGGLVDALEVSAADAAARGEGDAARRASRVLAEAQEALSGSSSYGVMENSPALKSAIDEASNRLQRDYERALRGVLRGQKVTGVVIAINGEVIWADIFADPGLFEKYWPKLLRSYVVEAMSVPAYEHARASQHDAERFLLQQDGRQVIEVEPGEFRLVHVDHPRYDVFRLVSLWEKSEPLLHFSKLRKAGVTIGKIHPMERRR